MVVLAATASLIILVRAALKSEDQSRSSLAAIAGIAILSYLHSIVDFSLQIPGYLIPFAVLLGCGLARATSDPTQRRKLQTREFVAVGTGSSLEPTPMKSS
jgi:hypothetical protein